VRGRAVLPVDAVAAAGKPATVQEGTGVADARFRFERPLRRVLVGICGLSLGFGVWGSRLGARGLRFGV